MESSGRNSN